MYKRGVKTERKGEKGRGQGRKEGKKVEKRKNWREERMCMKIEKQGEGEKNDGG